MLVREFPTTSGPIDALAVDADGDVYLIETKLYKNADKRRVIAQIMDYGAALWRAAESPESFVERIDEILTARFQTTLVSTISTYYSLEGPQLTQYMDSLNQSVVNGRFRFVVLMDQLDDGLKNLISFINTNSSFDILGVGLDFYQHEGLDILIPTLFGAETKKAAGPSTSGARRPWNSETFFADADARNDGETVSAARELLAWCEANADEVSWGTGAKSGSFSPKFARIDPHSILSLYSNGDLTFNFKRLDSNQRAVDWARDFGEHLRDTGVFPSLPADFANRHIYLKPEIWKSRVPLLLRTLDEMIGRVNAG